MNNDETIKNYIIKESEPIFKDSQPIFKDSSSEEEKIQSEEEKIPSQERNRLSKENLDPDNAFIPLINMGFTDSYIGNLASAGSQFPIPPLANLDINSELTMEQKEKLMR